MRRWNREAVAGFAIGHLPSTLHITGEDEPRVTDLDESKLSDLMCVAMSTQLLMDMSLRLQEEHINQLRVTSHSLRQTNNIWGQL